jgi:transcriptional regulator GlxA family with amidase domain
MTNMVYFLPMTLSNARPHRIVVVAYEGCQLLDVTGPAAVFGAANEGRARPFYEVAIVSPEGGAVVTNSGVALHSRKVGGQPDTLLVAGGSRGLKAAMEHAGLRRWLCRAAPKARRYGSVCTGAFVLAAAGLLDGKRVATHWSSCDRLAESFANLEVDADSLYVVDGKVWTSAGVTTGIDMALALVEADLGGALANLIARHFVLYARRPGYQSQFSPCCRPSWPAAAETPFVKLIDWMQAHLTSPDAGRPRAPAVGAQPIAFTEATAKTPAHLSRPASMRPARWPRVAAEGDRGQGGLCAPGGSARLERRAAPTLFREMK